MLVVSASPSSHSCNKQYVCQIYEENSTKRWNGKEVLVDRGFFFGIPLSLFTTYTIIVGYVDLQAIKQS